MFTSIKHYKRFNPSFQSLRLADLSLNQINQEASELFENAPPHIKVLNVTKNKIRGQLPNPFPLLGDMTHLALDHNNLNGSLPDISRSMPRLKMLDLSDQSSNGGFTGYIPDGFSNLLDLVLLDLAQNKLSETIPAVLGNLPNLEALNLSNNELKGMIPTELGRLAGVINTLDLSRNNFNNNIPSELGRLRSTSVLLNGNPTL